MKKRTIKQIWYLMAPVLIAIAVFFIPSRFQEIFVLKMDNLTLWSWFTYIFVHENLPHLTRNIIFYLFAIITAWAICPKKDKEKFAKPFLLILFLTPFISLIITILIWKVGGILLLNHRGFSGITSAAIGTLGFFIANRIYTLWNVKNKLILLQLCYFILIPSLAIMAWNLSKALSIFAFILWILMIFNLVFILKKDRILIDTSKWNYKEVSIICFSLIVLFVGSLLLVPENLINESGSAVNAIAHLIGFVIGFLTYFIWSIKQKDQSTKK
jgi:membrane associated rhomboid family serine protease